MNSVLFIAKEHQYCYILIKTNKFNNHYSLPHYKAKKFLSVSMMKWFYGSARKSWR